MDFMRRTQMYYWGGIRRPEPIPHLNFQEGTVHKFLQRVSIRDGISRQTTELLWVMLEISKLRNKWMNNWLLVVQKSLTYRISKDGKDVVYFTTRVTPTLKTTFGISIKGVT